MFKCSYCGKEYDNAPGRARCELICYEKQQEEIERKRQAEMQEQKEFRIKELNDAYRQFVNLAAHFRHDYGERYMPVETIPDSNFWDAFWLW